MKKDLITNNFALGIVGLFIFFSCSTCLAEGVKSPFNDLELESDNKITKYSFFIGGHLYGASEDWNSEFPSSTIISNIDMINANGASFFVSLGDNFRESDRIQIENFKKSFASRVTIPIFNSVGNHDVQDRLLYEENFGDTYFDFVYGNELFVFLDTESDKGNVGFIKGDQLSYFQNIIKNCRENPDINNVFIFSHKLIWSVDNPDYANLFEHVNSKAGYPNSNYNFRHDIEPYLIELSLNDKAVYWFSGDIGTSSSFTFFYGKDKKYDITYIATGIGDTREDAILRVEVEKNGEVRFIPISLSGKKMQIVEYYDDEFWKKYSDRQRSRKARAKKFKYFSLGVLSNFLIYGLFSLYRRIKTS